jgi:hypothetical protein
VLGLSSVLGLAALGVASFDPGEANSCDIRLGIHSCGQAVCVMEQLVTDRDSWFERR